MKLIPSLSVLASALTFAGSALASDVPTSRAHFCTLHYSKLAYGKEVKSVMAHTGTQTCSYDGRAYWDGIQDVQLLETASHDRMTGKVVLKAESTTYKPCALTPVLQFWVEFEDGSTKIETVVPMNVVRSYRVNEANPADTNAQAKSAVEKFFRAETNEAIDTVACFSVWSYGDAALEFADMLAPQE